MYATRLPAMTQYKVKTDPTFSKEKLNNQIPPHVRWKGENFFFLPLRREQKPIANHKPPQLTTTTIFTKRLHVSML